MLSANRVLKGCATLDSGGAVQGGRRGPRTGDPGRASGPAHRLKRRCPPQPPPSAATAAAAAAARAALLTNLPPTRGRRAACACRDSCMYGRRWTSRRRAASARARASRRFRMRAYCLGLTDMGAAAASTAVSIGAAVGGCSAPCGNGAASGAGGGGGTAASRADAGTGRGACTSNRAATAAAAAGPAAWFFCFVCAATGSGCQAGPTTAARHGLHALAPLNPTTTPTVNPNPRTREPK